MTRDELVDLAVAKAFDVAPKRARPFDRETPSQIVSELKRLVGFCGGKLADGAWWQWDGSGFSYRSEGAATELVSWPEVGERIAEAHRPAQGSLL